MAEKDSYWFRHDSTAGRELKMRKMQHIYSHWGKGVYWDVIEILRDQSEYQFENDETSLQMLADLIGCKDAVKFISWYRDCVKFGLLYETETHFYSKVLIKNMSRWESSKANGSKGGRPKKEDEKPKPKPRLNPTNNLDGNLTETIIEEDSIEDNKTKDNINRRKLKFTSELSPFIKIYGKPMIDEFYNYWTENNKSNTKFKKELEKTWDLDKRLLRWNNNNFGKKQFDNTPKVRASVPPKFEKEC